MGPRTVPQLDPWGCGVACVAFVVGMKYEDAKRRLFVSKGVK